MIKPIAFAASAVAVAAALVGLGATNASANAACGSAAPPDLDHSAYVSPLTNVDIHTGSDVNCTSIGLLTTAQNADFYCYTINYSSGHTWTYLRDVATGKKGWVRDDFLPHDGSLVSC
jgi:hypothetical protein